MPISAKGQSVLSDFIKRHGEKLGKKYFYMTANSKGKGSPFYKLAHGDK